MTTSSYREESADFRPSLPEAQSGASPGYAPCPLTTAEAARHEEHLKRLDRISFAWQGEPEATATCDRLAAARAALVASPAPPAAPARGDATITRHDAERRVAWDQNVADLNNAWRTPR